MCFSSGGVGNAPGIVGVRDACLVLEYREDVRGGSRARVHGAPRKSEKNDETATEVDTCRVTVSPHTRDSFGCEFRFPHCIVVVASNPSSSRAKEISKDLPSGVEMRRVPRAKSKDGRIRAMRGYRFWLSAVFVPWWTMHHSRSQARPSRVICQGTSGGTLYAAQLLIGYT